MKLIHASVLPIINRAMTGINGCRLRSGKIGPIVTKQLILFKRLYSIEWFRWLWFFKRDALIGIGPQGIIVKAMVSKAVFILLTPKNQNPSYIYDITHTVYLITWAQGKVPML